MSFGIFLKRNGVEVNLYKDGRIFKTKKWASTLLYRFRHAEDDLYIKEVPDQITETDRVNWFISRSRLAIRHPDIGLTTLNFAPDPRSYIDTEILRERQK